MNDDNKMAVSNSQMRMASYKMEQKQQVPEVDEMIQFKPILNPDHSFTGKWITIKGNQ